MCDVGIVIVTYNSGPEIGACLDALAAVPATSIVVVDNCSTDGTVAEATCRSVRVVQNPTNRGFAAAVNQGITLLASPFVLLLNPDAVLQTGLEALREACLLPGSAGAGGCLLDPAGRKQTGFMVRRFPTPAVLTMEALLLNRVWPDNPVNRRYRCLEMDYSARVPVDQPAGAFLMLRTDVWRELGGFDERFRPLWFEDVDFCRRVADRGYRLYFEPRAVAKHTGAHSISRLPVEKRRVYWYGSLLSYSAKHFGPISFRVVCLAVMAGSVLRSFGESARHRNLGPLLAYGRVVWFAGRCFLFGWDGPGIASGLP